MDTTQISTIEELQDEITRLQGLVEEYQNIFDASPVMFWYKDTHNRVLRVNKSAAAFEGTSPEHVNGKHCDDLYPKEQADAFYADDLEVIESGKAKLGIIEQHTQIGTQEEMWVHTGKVPTFDADGEVAGVIAFAVDITEQKKARDELEAAHQQLKVKQQQLTRAQEVFRSTLDMLTNSIQLGGDRDELMTYIKIAQQQFERIDSTR